MPVPADLPPISRPTLLFFRWIARGYMRRGFHAVRVRGLPHFERFANRPEGLIVYANHGSWWDPMVSVLLAHRVLPRRRHFAPMDAQALARYGILQRIGIFAVDLESSRGAVRFLRTGEAILAAGGVLWVTPQGRFQDARTRPLVFKPGMAALAARAANTSGTTWLLPLAIEYPFWDERTPECLLSFAEPTRVAAGTTAADLTGVFEAALAAAQEDLREAAMARDPRAFHTLATGRAGTGGFYALGQRLKALATRRAYRPEHTAAPREDTAR